jgi:hypothetical protein
VLVIFGARGFALAACYAYLIGGAAGAGGYTAVTATSNFVGGKSLLDGYDLDKASSAGIAGGVTAIACMSTAGAQCVTAGAATSAIQYGYDSGTTPTQDPIGWGSSAIMGGVLAGFGGKTFGDLKATDPSLQTGYYGPRGLKPPTLQSAAANAVKGGVVSGGAGWLSSEAQDYICRGRVCAR